MAKSPTTSVKSREMIGGEQFIQRREVFDKHDTVFLPPTPTTPTARYADFDPIITSNHGKTTTNFKRNAPAYSSMRESRTGEREPMEFRTRKYSDNFKSELNQGDDIDYRYSMTERTRRLSKLRKEFLNSNIHDTSNGSPFPRTGVRASLPSRNGPINYKIESPNLHKFSFAEPFSTPPPVRRVVVDLDSSDDTENKDKENRNPGRPKHISMPVNERALKADHQKLFEELVKRYSPQRKLIDWKLPPTKPRVVGTVPKSSTSGSVDGADGTNIIADPSASDDVFNKTEKSAKISANETEGSHVQNPVVAKLSLEERNDSNISLTELEEKNDEVPELSILQRQISRESPINKRPILDKTPDLNIPALLEKMTAEGEENHKNDKKKVKRKRSFLDKLLGRKKGDKKSDNL